MLLQPLPFMVDDATNTSLYQYLLAREKGISSHPPTTGYVKRVPFYLSYLEVLDLGSPSQNDMMIVHSGRGIQTCMYACQPLR